MVKVGLLIIDEDKCKKDGICAQECPMAIISQKDEDSFPELVQGGEELCLKCGHCVVVCPHGACSHTQVPIEDCPPIEKDLVLDEAHVVQFLRSRRSVRFYKDKPVEKEKIQHLLEIARYAPTGSNNQAVEYLVYNDRDKIRELAKMTVDWMRDVMENQPDAANSPYIPLVVAAWDFGIDVILRSAPALITASAPKTSTNGLVDVSLALSYMDLAAQPFGLGACWAGILQAALLASPPLKAALGIPEDHTHHYAMMLGYPKFKYNRLPERKKPKITWR